MQAEESLLSALGSKTLRLKFSGTGWVKIPERKDCSASCLNISFLLKCMASGALGVGVENSGSGLFQPAA